MVFALLFHESEMLDFVKAKYIKKERRFFVRDSVSSLQRKIMAVPGCRKKNALGKWPLDKAFFCMAQKRSEIFCCFVLVALFLHQIQCDLENLAMCSHVQKNSSDICTPKLLICVWPDN